MSILIITLPSDAHSLSVSWGLSKMGVNANVVCWSDYTRAIKTSLEFDNSGAQEFNAEITEEPKSTLPFPGDVRVLWNHRTAPFLPPKAISKADYPAINVGADIFSRGYIDLVETNAFCVNAQYAKRKMDNKIWQTQLAIKCGLSIPKTLFSNNPADISKFLHGNDSSIVKPLRYQVWNGNGRDYRTLTTRISSISEFEAEAVSACPMIYQQEIPKLCEYRIVFFGDAIFSFRIDSQDEDEAKLDWRAVSYRTLNISIKNVPNDLIEKIKHFIRVSGLAYGSFDFIQKQDGSFVFLEINESGQFLWLEEQCPEIPLLDYFCQFLIAGRFDWFSQSRAQTIAFHDWRVDWKDHFQVSTRNHVGVNLDKRLPDIV